MKTSMPAFKIHLADGTSYVTSMAIGTTLEIATAYFKGNILNLGLGPNDHLVRCTNVEQIV
jgi:hypothetical protein